MAELDMRERRAGDVTILDLNGKIRTGESSEAVRNAVRRLLDEGKRKILLNLAGVTSVDSNGIGAMVSSLGEVNRDEGQLKLLNLPPDLRDVMGISKLLTVFDSHHSEAAALNAF